jgi:TetR/AcrR family transcriptional regulator, cholesterol catabolism regulator
VPSRIQNQELLRSGRKAIVKAAIDLFEKNGFHATPVADIAENAHLTVGALYKYIRSKHDILYLVTELQTEEIEAAVDRWLQSDEEPIEAVKGAIRDYAKIVDSNRKTVVIVYREMHNLDKDARRYLLAQESRLRLRLMELLSKAASANVRANHEQLMTITDNLLLLVHMWAVNHRVYAARQTIDDFIEMQTLLTIRQIDAEPARVAQAPLT